MSQATKDAPLEGTRPKGTQTEREASEHVREMFSRIAPRYDFLNHLLSFSLDYGWRRHAAQRFERELRRPEARVLDLCCGTGDLTLALNRERARVIGDEGARRMPVIGCDFARPMLELAQVKAKNQEHAAVFMAADAMNLPFPDGSFDLATSAFGFRNLVNYEEGLREIARVLKPGGRLGILECSQPTGPMAGIFRFYFQRVLPIVGGAISGSGEAYAYLPSSVEKFPSGSELAALMEKTGFGDVRVESWNFGSVLLHTATRKQG